MFPDYYWFQRRRLMILTFIALLSSLLLCYSFMRNMVQVSFIELTIGLLAISIVISFSITNDEEGFWSYALHARRFILAEDKLIRILVTSNTALGKKWFIFPMVIACHMGIFSVCYAVITYYFFYDITSVMILLFSLFFSLYLLFLLRHGLLYRQKNIRLFTFSHKLSRLFNKKQQEVGSKNIKTIYSFIVIDLCLVLFANFAIVLPIQKKSAFNLTKGALTPEFIVAFLILMWIVLICTLIGANKRNRYVIAGEILSGFITEQFIQHNLLFSRMLSKQYWKRYLFYFFSVTLWSLCCCFFYQLVNIKHFAVLYLGACVMIAAIFIYERYFILILNYYQAKDIVTRLGKCGFIEFIKKNIQELNQQASEVKVI